MRIVSYNVNGLRPRLSCPPRTLAAFLNSLDADIICLQETKIARHDLTADIAVAEGYESFFSCNRYFKKGRIGYSGVATFCRVGNTPSSTSPILPVAADEGFTGLLHRSQTSDSEAGKGRVGCYEEVAKTELSTQELLQLDSEGRCIITDHGHFVLFNLYCPRVECGDMDRMKFKLDFFTTLQHRWEALLNNNRRIIAVGDFNICPSPIDHCDPGPDFEKNISRKWFRSLLKHEGGPFLDVFRFCHPDRKGAYTCWSQTTGAEEFNYGTRIDLIIAAGSCTHQTIPRELSDERSHGFVKCEVQQCDILGQFRRVAPDSLPRWQGGRSLKLEGSDHAPIVVHWRGMSPVEPHSVPPLAARFMPEIRGRQQNLVTLMERQPSPLDYSVAVSKRRKSLSGTLSGKTLQSEARGTITSMFNGKRTQPFNTDCVVAKDNKINGVSALISKRQGVRIVQRSNSQQKDLRTFFVKSSRAESPLADDKGRHLNVTVSSNTWEGLSISGTDSGSGQSFSENITDLSITESRKEFKARNEDFEGITFGSDVLENQESYQVLSGVISREEQGDSQSQVNSDCRGSGEIDIENLMQLEPVRSVEETQVVANVAWSRIREKMHRAVHLCKGHDEPCVARVVKKASPNIGRGFYVCARAQGPSSNPQSRCDHFEWAAAFKTGGKGLVKNNAGLI